MKRPILSTSVPPSTPSSGTRYPIEIGLHRDERNRADDRHLSNRLEEIDDSAPTELATETLNRIEQVPLWSQRLRAETEPDLRQGDRDTDQHERHYEGSEDGEHAHGETLEDDVDATRSVHGQRTDSEELLHELRQTGEHGRAEERQAGHGDEDHERGVDLLATGNLALLTSLGPALSGVPGGFPFPEAVVGHDPSTPRTCEGKGLRASYMPRSKAKSWASI